MSSPPRSAVLPWLLIPIAVLGMAALWTLFTLGSGLRAPWMALVAGIDLALIVRLARLPGGARRAALAVAGTVVCVALAQWGIAGGDVGRSVGMLPWEAIPRMGPHFTWTLTQLATSPTDIGWMLAGVAVAGWFGR